MRRAEGCKAWLETLLVSAGHAWGRDMGYTDSTEGVYQWFWRNDKTSEVTIEQEQGVLLWHQHIFLQKFQGSFCTLSYPVCFMSCPSAWYSFFLWFVSLWFLSSLVNMCFSVVIGMRGGCVLLKYCIVTAVSKWNCCSSVYWQCRLFSQNK